ncbi:tRNA synthetases class I, catalytic domain-containing protein [Scenedesmus sp. NREL 46B-D3]|nr:tRNA synthetases class I, catalytic domain-containing protein [Scenedesmus sp. NREL 46B-D3]
MAAAASSQQPHANLALQHAADPKATNKTTATLKFPSGEELVGVPIIVKFLTRLGAQDGSNLYGPTPLAACQVDQWIETSSQLVSGQQFEALCGRLSDYLSLRSFFVGYGVTAADMAIWGQLQACPLWKKVRQSSSAAHLVRWFDHISSLPACAAAVEDLCPSKKREAAAAADTAAGKGGGDVGSFDVGLPNAQMGKVVTRFPPEPSGYLHIGHAKAALLNQHFANIYKGKLLEKDEYVENIIKDMQTLGLQYKTITYTSDYFPQMLDLGERLIRAGVLYADDTPVDQMREERMHGIESKRRNRSAEETLGMFKEMQAGSEEGLKNCLRFKLDMQAGNKALRDPVAFRCNLQHHWRTAHTYKVYPTYDFACPFVDAIEGVTHALRTSEYKDREAQYYWILEQQQKVWPGLPNVHIWDYSRLNFVYTVLSKRKLTWFVQTERVAGWDDPRMPTVQGIFRRGLQVEALREFILSQGASKNVTYQEWDKIWTINKKLIDPVCPRHTAVAGAGKVLLTLEGAPSSPESSSIAKHKKNADAGSKTLLKLDRVWLDQADGQEVKEGEEVTLMDWGNAIIKSVSKAPDGQVTGLSGQLHLAGDFKKTRLKLTWLADVPELVPLTLTDFDYLIMKKKVEEDDDFEQLVSPDTKLETAAVGDVNMASLKKGDILQLERKGYFICDVPYGGSADKPAVLLSIPDGRTK